jgi:hypothetical protein
VDRLFTDKASGKDSQRPQLDALLSFAREGDTVVVHSMDRLARNLDDLRRLVQQLTKRGIRIEFVKECLSFTGEDSPMAVTVKLPVVSLQTISLIKSGWLRSGFSQTSSFNTQFQVAPDQRSGVRIFAAA